MSESKPAFPPIARAHIASMAGSRIRDVANAALGEDGVLAFWFGESDQPTPRFIREAAIEALEAGRTFYTHNLGRPDLRARIAAYLGDLHGFIVDEARLAVTSSGVSALMIAMQALLDPGDRVVVITPVWPNVSEIPSILNADVARFPLTPGADAWTLDLDGLLNALTPKTRLLLLASPGNPTGWTLAAQDRQVILDHCRRLGIWIIADDVYERLSLAPNLPNAPSFLPLADARDRLISVNSFSKAWRMTGWRLGWMVAPAELIPDLGKLLEFNTSCAPDFIQHAASIAIAHGEPHVAELRRDLIAKRDRLLPALRAAPGVLAPEPQGGMYAFFRMPGAEDSVALAKALIADVGLGLAPGSAFGPEGEGWLRWCFAAETAKLDEGVTRFLDFARRNTR